MKPFAASPSLPSMSPKRCSWVHKDKKKHHIWQVRKNQLIPPPKKKETQIIIIQKNKSSTIFHKKCWSQTVHLFSNHRTAHGPSGFTQVWTSKKSFGKTTTSRGPGHKPYTIDPCLLKGYIPSFATLNPKPMPLEGGYIPSFALHPLSQLQGSASQWVAGPRGALLWTRPRRTHWEDLSWRWIFRSLRSFRRGLQNHLFTVLGRKNLPKQIVAQANERALWSISMSLPVLCRLACWVWVWVNRVGRV